MSSLVGTDVEPSHYSNRNNYKVPGRMLMRVKQVGRWGLFVLLLSAFVTMPVLAADKVKLKGSGASFRCPT